MKLTEQQIEQLFTFTKKHLVEHYDVQVELVDHLANAIEAQWAENPNISFEDALEKEFKSFGVFGFTGLVEQKQHALQAHYWSIIKKEIIRFFTIPKIIFTALLVYLLFNVFSHPTALVQQIWTGVEIALFIVTICVWIYQMRRLKKGNRKYLLYAICNYFYSLPVLFIVYFQSHNSRDLNFLWTIIKTSLTAFYILFCIILFTKILPMLKHEIKEVEKKYNLL